MCVFLFIAVAAGGICMHVCSACHLRKFFGQTGFVRGVYLMIFYFFKFLF